MLRPLLARFVANETCWEWQGERRGLKNDIHAWRDSNLPPLTLRSHNRTTVSPTLLSFLTSFDFSSRTPLGHPPFTHCSRLLLIWVIHLFAVSLRFQIIELLIPLSMKTGPAKDITGIGFPPHSSVLAMGPCPRQNNNRFGLFYDPWLAPARPCRLPRFLCVSQTVVDEDTFYVHWTDEPSENDGLVHRSVVVEDSIRQFVGLKDFASRVLWGQYWRKCNWWFSCVPFLLSFKDEVLVERKCLTWRERLAVILLITNYAEKKMLSFHQTPK